MTTVHSNSPRDALSRLETMVLMSGFDLPVRAIREQIMSAINVIMHLDRLPDGRRVVTHVTELQGMEGDTILMQELFRLRQWTGPEGVSQAELAATGLRPKFMDKLAVAGVEVPAKVFRADRTLATVTDGGRGRRAPVPAAASLVAADRAR